jgi:hypothetical protein
MIEINLIPDVKQELLAAKRIRTYVISSAVLVGAVFVGVVVALGVYLVLVQTVRNSLEDNTIKEKSAELQKVKDLSNILTIQNQLTKLGELHATKNIDSRVFSLLAAINPAAPNEVSISSAKVDSETKRITIDGQAVNGYEAAEALKKTILGTSISYKTDDSGETKKASLTQDVSTSEMSYGEDSTGKKVLRFTLAFTYADEFFARSSSNAIIDGPNRQNVTDSFLRIPQSLFSQRATTIGEDQ